MRSCCCPRRALGEEEALYTGIIGKDLNVYARGSEEANVLGRIEAGTIVDVYEKMRTFTKIGYEGQVGYVLTKFTERCSERTPLWAPCPAPPPTSPSVA